LVAGAFAVGLAGMLLLGQTMARFLSDGWMGQMILHTGSRLVALGFCLWFARIRTGPDFVRILSLGRTTQRLVILPAMFGVLIAVVAKVLEPGGAASLSFQPYVNIAITSVVSQTFFEEAVMRGYYFPALRGAVPLAVSILVVFAMDTALLHQDTVRFPRALLLIAVVNIVTCLLREQTNSLWPPMAFHIAFQIPFAILV
jgi:membrane protease YdiL (CAAX protease family)